MGTYAGLQIVIDSGENPEKTFWHWVDVDKRSRPTLRGQRPPEDLKYSDSDIFYWKLYWKCWDCLCCHRTGSLFSECICYSQLYFVIFWWAEKVRNSSCVVMEVSSMCKLHYGFVSMMQLCFIVYSTSQHVIPTRYQHDCPQPPIKCWNKDLKLH